jgi:plastocyanin
VSDPACVAAHPAGLTITDVQELDGQLAGVFVYIAHGLEDRVFAVPDQPVLVDQHDCLYTPRVIGAQVGQQIVFLNSDDTLHNVHGEPTASAPWDFGLGLQGARRTITIDHAEVAVPWRSDVHPWMLASIGVVALPYYAVTNATGTFGLSDLPAGHYVVAAWHPTLGTLQAEVDITAGDALEIELVFTPQKDGK